MMENNMDDLMMMSPEETDMFRDALDGVYKNLESLLSSQDEYLVYMGESNVYPLMFDARSVVGRDKYECIKAIMYPSATATAPRSGH